MAGELDVYAAPIARSFLGRILDSGPARIIVDASGISFVDASGVGVVAFAARRARSYGSELVMDRLTAGMARVLDLTGVSRLLGAADTDTSARVPAAL